MQNVFVAITFFFFECRARSTKKCILTHHWCANLGRTLLSILESPLLSSIVLLAGDIKSNPGPMSKQQEEQLASILAIVKKNK